jgi:hypothetical protein
MYETHHQGINPICKRIRGITSLGKISLRNTSHPNAWSDIEQYFDMIDAEALELETQTLKKVKEFEHLQ